MKEHTGEVAFDITVEKYNNVGCCPVKAGNAFVISALDKCEIHWVPWITIRKE